jgi:hypothetical protein
MGPARPPHGMQRRRDEAPLGCDDYAYDEYTDDDAVSLLEENARLRKLVVSLSELVLRKVVDAK